MQTTLIYTYIKILSRYRESILHLQNIQRRKSCKFNNNNNNKI